MSRYKKKKVVAAVHSALIQMILIRCVIMNAATCKTQAGQHISLLTNHQNKKNLLYTISQKEYQNIM